MNVNEVARILGKKPETIRIGLQMGVFPFGTAYKTHPDNRNYTYVIFPEKVREFVGGEINVD